MPLLPELIQPGAKLVMNFRSLSDDEFALEGLNANQDAGLSDSNLGSCA